MGRDHSCEVCGRGGLNDPDGKCECFDSVRVALAAALGIRSKRGDGAADRLARIALAALGLDDFDAAVERGAEKLDYGLADGRQHAVDEAREVLLAALVPPPVFDLFRAEEQSEHHPYCPLSYLHYHRDTPDGEEIVHVTPDFRDGKPLSEAIEDVYADGLMDGQSRAASERLGDTDNRDYAVRRADGLEASELEAQELLRGQYEERAKDGDRIRLLETALREIVDMPAFYDVRSFARGALDEPPSGGTCRACGWQLATADGYCLECAPPDDGEHDDRPLSEWNTATWSCHCGWNGETREDVAKHSAETGHDPMRGQT